MNKIITMLIALVLGWYGYQKYQAYQQQIPFEAYQTPTEYVASPEPDEPVSSNQFKCDGRTHCSQMTSCEEATFFINNCPGTKMDGNHDGIPCERQWCK